MSRIDAYVARLESQLRHLPEARRRELIDEIHAHLWMSRREHLSNGEQLAEKEAVERLGPADLLAEELLRRESGIESKPAWRVAIVPMTLLTLYSLVPTLLIYSKQIRLLEWVDWLGLAFVASLVWSVWRSRRWLVKPLVATAVAMHVLGMLLVLNPPSDWWYGVSKSEAREGYARQIREGEQNLRLVRAVAAGDLNAAADPTSGFRAPMASKMVQGTRLPFLHITLRQSESDIVVLGTVNSRTAALEAWRARGAQLERHLQKELDETRLALAQLEGRVPVRFETQALTVSAVFLAYHALFFAVVNALVLWVSDFRRRRRFARPTAA